MSLKIISDHVKGKRREQGGEFEELCGRVAREGTRMRKRGRERGRVIRREIVKRYVEIRMEISKIHAGKYRMHARVEMEGRR